MEADHLSIKNLIMSQQLIVTSVKRQRLLFDGPEVFGVDRSCHSHVVDDEGAMFLGMQC